jgi:hypothetical protein
LARTESIQSTEDALLWMLNRKMIIKTSTKDPETFANIQGYLLTEDIRDTIGTNILRLFAKVTSRQNSRVKRVTVRDAFLTATIAVLLAEDKAKFSEDQMVSCANVVLALLPFDMLEKEGIAEKTLVSLARDRKLVARIQKIFV